MKGKIAILFLSLLTSISYAQNKNIKDSLFIEINNSKASIVHLVKEQETSLEIAQQYNVPATLLNQKNNLSFYDRLEKGQKIAIPLGVYNYQSLTPSSTNYKALYYNNNRGFSIQKIANALDISQEILEKLNPQTNKNILLCGWVKIGFELPSSNKASLVDNTTHAPAASLAPGAVIKSQDTTNHIPTEFEKVFNYQTSNGIIYDSTAGMVVFYKPQSTKKTDLLYAFSDEVPRGKVIKVINPSNQKCVFVKVIGALPKTKQYLNAKLGVDGRARELLETREIKLWCDLILKY